jgi:plastocyanin
MRARSNALAVALCAVACTAKAPEQPPAKPSPRTLAVTIEGMRFSPETIQAAVGDTVVWTNKDLVPHTVSAVDASFDSGSIAPGTTFTLLVKTPGAKPYACRFHPTMKATLDVR